ncbi:hypothetical protein FGO68_gene3381 [Halteria grandinella]|uniref:Uncharacterized protein n=1 Tax=Halteria grandinella TaxID=5974 RepID=A0A8J8NKJ5_HALGN|nr:hypothetical protein FGO68_gene3381 [Halteria grandinella]
MKVYDEHEGERIEQLRKLRGWRYIRYLEFHYEIQNYIRNRLSFLIFIYVCMHLFVLRPKFSTTACSSPESDHAWDDYMAKLMEAVQDPLNADLENLPEPSLHDITEKYLVAFWLIFYNSLFTFITTTSLPWLQCIHNNIKTCKGMIGWLRVIGRCVHILNYGLSIATIVIVNNTRFDYGGQYCSDNKDGEFDGIQLLVLISLKWISVCLQFAMLVGRETQLAIRLWKIKKEERVQVQMEETARNNETAKIGISQEEPLKEQKAEIEVGPSPGQS